MDCAKECITVGFGVCAMKACLDILRKREWPVSVQWMDVIRTVQCWKQLTR